MSHTPLNGLRMLLVEGDAVLGPALAGILRGEGAVVDGPWSSLRMATGAMHHHPPEAALLDINLSDGITYALAASLQSMGIAYAFLSASDPADVPPGLAPVAFAKKPASTRVVLAMAHRLARER